MIIINITASSPTASGIIGSYIRRVKPPVKTLCNVNCNFTCGDCDAPFSYLVDEEDILRLQFNVPDYYNPDPSNPIAGWDTGSGGWLQADILDAAGNVEISNVTTLANSQYTAGFATGYLQGTFFQNLNLNVGAIIAEVGKCFSVRLAFCGRLISERQYVFSGFFTDLPDPRDFEAGKSIIVTEPTNVYYTLVNGAWVAPSPQPAFDGGASQFFDQSTGQWWQFDEDWEEIPPPSVATDCDAPKFCTTATFRLAECNEPQVCFDSVATGNFDCAGNVYSDSSLTLEQQGVTQAVGDYVYRNSFCVVGSLERVAFEVERLTTSQGRVTKENTTSIYQLRTHVPEVVAERIKNAMLPQGFTINGLTFDTYDGISKENDDSSMWHIDTQLRVKDCDSFDSCN